LTTLYQTIIKYYPESIFMGALNTKMERVNELLEGYQSQQNNTSK